MKLEKWAAWSEITASIAVVVTLVVLVAEVRGNTEALQQSNVHAKAAAYQAIGIATQQYFLNRDARVIRLYTEADHPEALSRWTLGDWEVYSNDMLSGLRMMETVQLQVEQELLEREAMESLGYSLDDHQAIATPGFVCLWPTIRGAVGSSLRDLIERSVQEFGVECQIDVQSLRDQVADSTVGRG